MALNDWWFSDTAQRYWMEVATTGSLGQILIAPKFEGASWSYELVSQVQEGDRVLHWESTEFCTGSQEWGTERANSSVGPWRLAGLRSRQGTAGSLVEPQAERKANLESPKVGW